MDTDYRIPDGSGFKQPYQMANDMVWHWKNLPKDQTVIEGDLIKEDGLGAVASKLDNEILQGIVGRDNYKLVFEPDPVLHDLVDAIRDKNQEVWLELTLEQLPDFSPAAPNKKISDARKIRNIFWGRLIRNEAKGHVDKQNFPTTLIKDADAELHIGDFECSFQSWLTLFAARPASDFLDHYRSLYDPLAQDWILPMSNLFYKLIEWITPVNLIAMSDDTLKTETQGLADNEKSIDRANFRLHYELVDPTFTYFAKDLWHIRFEVAKGGVYRPLFFGSESGLIKEQAPAVSLYSKWKIIGDVLNTLPREFRLKFQIELPTLDDVGKYEREALPALSTGLFSNDARDRTKYWAACARWIFTEPDKMPLKLASGSMTVIENTIDYTPAALFANKIDIKETEFDWRTADDYEADDNYGQTFDTTIPNSSTLETSGGHFYSKGKSGTHEQLEDSSADEAGQEISYELLFRLSTFISVYLNFAGAPVPYLLDGGNTIYIYDEGTDALYDAYGVKGFNPKDKDQIALTWADFHFIKEKQLWSNCRALLEFEIEGVGIANFPTIKNFDLLDWGDFPHLRIFDASPGILFDKLTGRPIVGIFAVFDISQQPGGSTKIRAIEIGDFVIIILPNVPPTLTGPPHLDPPVIDAPPPFSGSPVCGIITITFCILYPAGCIDHADVFVNGVAYSTNINTFPDPMPEDCVPVTIAIDTTTLPNGGNQVCVTIYPCTGGSVTQCWNFTVNNPCTGGNTPVKIFSA